MKFPFKRIDSSESEADVSATVLEAAPETVLPALSVQEAWNGSRGIVRGRKRNGVIFEDHACDTLDNEGRLIESTQEIVGAEQIRAKVWTIQRHLRDYSIRHPDDHVLAWSSNGNLLANPHFVAFDGRLTPPRLYALASERQHLGQGRRLYTCLVVRKPGREPRVTIERVYFEDGPRVFDEHGNDVTGEVEYAAYGQMIVDDGNAIDESDLIRMAENQEIYDLRHLFLFGRTDIAPARWLDVGLGAFWRNDGTMDAANVSRAIRGDSIETDVGHIAEDVVHAAMARKGYVRRAVPSRRGEYWLGAGVLRVVLEYGIYPHTAVGIGSDGRLIVAAIGGLSNRVGVTLLGAAESMRALGARMALLVDNGSDVAMGFGDQMIASTSNGQRTELRSLLLYRAASPRAQQGVRWVRYPG